MAPDPIAGRRRQRTAVVGVGVVALLAAFNVGRSALLPADTHLVANLALAGAVLALGAVAGLTGDELGLVRGRVGAGLRWGAGAAAVVAGVVGVAALVPASRGAFDDARADVDAGGLVWAVLVVIPLGTVLVEEVVFRGVVLALLLRLVSTRWAVVWSSVLFGLWHVYPAWRDSGDNALVDSVDRPLAVAGTLVATTAAGVVFAWLRVRSGSLLAPLIAHLATNTVPLVAAWVVVRS